MKERKTLSDEEEWSLQFNPDGTIKLVQTAAPHFEPLIVNDDPFLEPDESDPDDAADEAQDRANGLLTSDD